MFRAAEAAGNHEMSLDWETRRAQFIKERHQRRMDMIEKTQQVMKALPNIVFGLFIGAGHDSGSSWPSA